MADLLTQEHYALLAAFEREHRGRTDKEDKSLWPKGVIYKDGHMNELFLAYRRGHAYAIADMRSEIQNLEAARNGYRDDARALHDALTRMVAAFESEFYREDIYLWRPDWLKSALARRNALEGNHDNQD